MAPSLCAVPSVAKSIFSSFVMGHVGPFVMVVSLWYFIELHIKRQYGLHGYIMPDFTPC